MIYKFNTIADERGSLGFLELCAQGDKLQIEMGESDPENPHSYQLHLLAEKELDDLIIALTNIKNEISSLKRGPRS